MPLPSRANTPNLAASNDRDLQAFFSNQRVIAGHLAALGYPFHLFLIAEVERSKNRDYVPYLPEELSREHLLKHPLKVSDRQRTGAFIDLKGKAKQPILEKEPLQQLAALLYALDDQRGSKGYEAQLQLFVDGYLASFSYSVTLGAELHLSSSSVSIGCLLSPSEQRERTAVLRKLYSENAQIVGSLVRANHGLVGHYAAEHVASKGGNLGDAVGWGKTGLCDGIFRYTPTPKHRQTTDVRPALGAVAAVWIQHHIRRSHQYHQATISIPVSAQQFRSSILKLVKGDGTPDFRALTEEYLLLTRAKKDTALAERIKSDRAAVLAELRSTESWLEEVGRTVVRVREAIELPRAQSVDWQDDETKRGAGVALTFSSSTALNDDDAASAIKAVDDALARLGPNDQLIVALSFNLPIAKAAGRRFLESIIEQSGSLTRALASHGACTRPAEIRMADTVDAARPEAKVANGEVATS